jgi:pantetheine-phosphate adenylyltransferase
MRTAIYPGSFDPITNGHVDVIERASRLFDRLVIAVAHNAEKKPLFTPEQRVDLITRCLPPAVRAAVEVTSFTGLLADFARQTAAAAIIRGLRAVTDFEYEFQMALMNKNLCPEIETVFLASREQYTYVSSRVIKEVARLGGDVSALVPGPVLEALKGAAGR